MRIVPGNSGNFLTDDFDSTVSFYQNVEPIRYFANKRGFYFIIQVNCSAGSNCAILHLLVVDKNKRFFKSVELGFETGEKNESTVIRYKLNGDSSLLTVYEVRYGEDTSIPIDSLEREFKLDQAMVTDRIGNGSKTSRP